MAPHDEEEDPAVYRSNTKKKSSSDPQPNDVEDDEMEEDEEEEEEEDDSALLTVLPGFNRLLLVLRDERVMRFVKYVSAAAEGSRWDVCGEYEVGVVQEGGDDVSESEGSS